MNTAIMSLIGFLIGGCANLMSAAVAADLGNYYFTAFINLIKILYVVRVPLQMNSH